MTNKIKEVVSERLSEKYYEIDHKSGLKIYVYPKENASSSYVIFGTRYGSIDTQFKLGTDTEFTCVPEGIAHFLEHKLFESEELDAFERYAKTGASANAYTSFDRTCYLFSCSGNLKENLEILMDFVTHPYFTEATVQKEQGIIGHIGRGEQENLVEDAQLARLAADPLQRICHGLVGVGDENDFSHLLQSGGFTPRKRRYRR